MKLFEKGWKKVGKDFERDGRISCSLHFQKSFCGLGLGCEKYYGCSNDITEQYIVYNFKFYLGPLIFNGTICGDSFPLKISNDDLYENNMN